MCGIIVQIQSVNNVTLSYQLKLIKCTVKEDSSVVTSPFLRLFYFVTVLFLAVDLTGQKCSNVYQMQPALMSDLQYIVFPKKPVYF